jgi:hypothetical protein
MRLFKSFLFVAAVGALAGLSGGRVGAQVPQFHQEVRVHGTYIPGSHGDAFLTFSGPFSVPGLSLAQGTYLFRRPVAGVLQVLSSDRAHVYIQAFTVPVSRPETTKDFEVQFAEPAVAGAPQRMVKLFAPGERVGQELIYYKGQIGNGDSN